MLIERGLEVPTRPESGRAGGREGERAGSRSPVLPQPVLPVPLDFDRPYPLSFCITMIRQADHTRFQELRELSQRPAVAVSQVAGQIIGISISIPSAGF